MISADSFLRCDVLWIVSFIQFWVFGVTIVNSNSEQVLIRRSIRLNHHFGHFLCYLQTSLFSLFFLFSYDRSPHNYGEAVGPRYLLNQQLNLSMEHHN